jgi:hypothetical protein
MLLSSSVWRGNARWWFAGGLLAGGLTSALVAVTVGSLLRPLLPATATLVLVAAVVAVVALGEWGLFTMRLPQNHRQVPQWVISEGDRAGPLQFGFEMGTGVRTFMTSGLPHVLAVSLLLLSSVPEAALAGVAFGSGRAWMTLSRMWSGDVDRWDAELSRWMRPLRAALAIAAAGCCVALLVGLS